MQSNFKKETEQSLESNYEELFEQQSTMETIAKQI